MCGICGKLYFKNNGEVSLPEIKQMTDSIRHRGPDDEGFHIDGHIGLGHRRLSIIDLSGGKQPMYDETGNIVVVFNGEIYNFPELKKELEGYGWTFRTKSDTEVIIYGYRQWGIDVLKKLNGMFAFSLWDKEKERLVIARDRLGIKLVYFRIEEGQLSFASEIRALFANNSAKPEVDTTALNLFLRYRYTPAPLTIYKGVKKLAAGTCMIVEKGEATVKRWWDFKPAPFDKAPSPKEAEEELLHLYKKAIKRQLISDVPVGLLLSGGLDSGMLLALMKENGPSWNTYSIGYGSSFKDDELSDAAHTARVLKSPNNSIEISRDIFDETLPKIIGCLEEPIASSSVVPMYHLCERVASNVKVALVGQGPDELFGGYKRHLGLRYSPYWRALPGPLRSAVGSILSKVSSNESIHRSLYSLDRKDRMRRYQNVFSIMPGEMIDSLFRDDLLPDQAGDEILNAWKPYMPLMENVPDELTGFQFLELRSSLPDELLMYADKLSMAHSLELRVPYLDHEIVEFVECLDASFKVRKGQRKWLHKQVCANYLPNKIIHRKKRGFAVNVVDDWFKNKMNSMSDTLIDPQSMIYNYLEPQTVTNILQAHQQGRCDNHKILFSLVVFEQWLRNNTNADVAAAPGSSVPETHSVLSV